MELITIPFGTPYDIKIPTLIGADESDNLKVAHMGIIRPTPDAAFVITDNTVVQKCRGLQFISALRAVIPRVTVNYVGEGEEHKSLATLTDLVEQAIADGVTKRSIVICFGGGLVLNVGGLVAALLYRGIRVVYVPTTFMAQHDVITSLKTAVNVKGRKNNVGAMHASTLNLVDVSYLDTLPESEWNSGLGEMAKNAVLLGGEHVDILPPLTCGVHDLRSLDVKRHMSPQVASLVTRGVVKMKRRPCLRKKTSTLDLVKCGIRAKASFLAADPRERHIGIIFEYGHTIGHALERTFELPHGIAVCWGMLAAGWISNQMGHLSDEAKRRHDDIIRGVCGEQRPFTVCPVTLDQMRTRIMADSKRGIVNEVDNEFSEILLRDIGDPFTELQTIQWDLAERWLQQSEQ